MTKKHTPGPWEAQNTEGAGWSVRKQHERPGYTGLAPICSMAWWQFDIPGIIDDEISGANARLIAAAPDLLAACEAALAWLTNVNVSDPATVGRKLMSALENAGYDKEMLDAAAVALVRGPCSVPNLCGDE